MKKFAAFILALLMVSSAAGAALSENGLEKVKAAGKLIVATSPDYAPYEFINLTTNEPVGADVSLANYIAEKLGVKLQLEAMDFDTVMAAVSNGSCDLALAGLVPKEERKGAMDFTDLYYNDGDQVIVILKKNADKYKKLADLKGQKVAGQNGTLQVDLITSQTEAVLEPITAINTGVMMLMTNKVEGIALASVVADQYAANYPDDLVIMDEKFEYTSLGVAGAVTKGNSEFLAAVNEILKEVVESGQYFTWIDEANQLNNEQSK